VDIVGITLPITKHSFALRDVEEIAPAIRKAFQIAKSGRPGPVLIDVPKDLMNAKAKYVKAEPLPCIASPQVSKEQIDELARLINESERPVIYAGGGVNLANASAELTKLAKKAQIPVGTTLMCLGCFSRKDPLSLGMIGMHGEKDANLAAHNSDLLINIGARFSDRVTGDTTRFAKNAKIIHIDIDHSEINKNIDADYVVIGDVKEILAALIPKVQKADHKEWNAKVHAWKRAVSDSGHFDPAAILRTVHDMLGDDTIVVTDVGQHQMWTAQKWPFTKPRHLITSGGLGTMGFGLGAAIGSQIANPSAQVVLFTGDGSFRMNMNELLTVSGQDLPILVFVLKNNTLGMVRQWQKLFFKKRYSATDIPDNLNYELLAASTGLKGYHVSDAETLKVTVTEAKASGKGAVIACEIYTDENVWPIVPPGDAIFNLVTNE
jgi:acetolactate synthase-1/2/3 large subunit